MKLDSEPLYGPSTLAHNPDFKSFEYNDNAMETGGGKLDNEIVREEKNGISCDLKSQKYQTDADALPAEIDNGDVVGNLPRVNGFMDMEDSINSRENVDSDCFTLYTIVSGELESTERESYFYTDKSVMECELPEVVCLKERTCNVVRDICIDEGVPSKDKILVENGEMDHRGLCSSPHSGVDANSNLVKVKVETVSPSSDAFKSLVEHDLDKDVDNQCGSDNLMQKGEGNFEARDEVANGVSDEKTMTESMLLMLELDTEKSHLELSNFNEDDGQQQYDQDPSTEGISAESVVSSAADEPNSSFCANGVSFSRKTESGSITFDFDSSTPASNGTEQRTQNVDDQQPLETQNMSGVEERVWDNLTSSSRSFFIQHGLGESSFSAMGLSGPIAYSGSITYSGNLSLHSDSSTTSTRSFAFPILQSEWNNSPVKMEKTERRHFRKHRGWGLGLLCCRF